MPKASITIANPESLTAGLRALSSALSESALRQAAAAGATVIFKEAKLRAPIGTAYERKGAAHKPGTLRNSMLVFFDSEDSVAGARATYGVTWSKEAFYGRFVEFGTSHAAAKPFLRPSFEARKADAGAEVQRVLMEKIDEAMNVR